MKQGTTGPKDVLTPILFVVWALMMACALLFCVFMLVGLVILGFWLVVVAWVTHLGWVGYQCFKHSRLRVSIWQILTQVTLISIALFLGTLPVYSYTTPTKARLLVSMEGVKADPEPNYLHFRTDDGQRVSWLMFDSDDDVRVMKIEGKSVEVTALLKTWNIEEPPLTGWRLFKVDDQAVTVPVSNLVNHPQTIRVGEHEYTVSARVIED